jgi:hypothetical protein
LNAGAAQELVPSDTTVYKKGYQSNVFEQLTMNGSPCQIMLQECSSGNTQYQDIVKNSRRDEISLFTA